MAKKITYHVRNWKDYNRSLINRGNLTLWFSEDAIKSWYQKPQKRNKRGRPFTYSNTYVELALTLGTLFRFSLRATQGFLEGLISLMGLQLEVSHYSRLSRRAAELDIQLEQIKKRGKTPTPFGNIYFEATTLILLIFGNIFYEAIRQRRRATFYFLSILYLDTNLHFYWYCLNLLK